MNPPLAIGRRRTLCEAKSIPELYLGSKIKLNVGMYTRVYRW
jgi:hypothetical protein